MSNISRIRAVTEIASSFVVASHLSGTATRIASTGLRWTALSLLRSSPSVRSIANPFQSCRDGTSVFFSTEADIPSARSETDTTMQSYDDVIQFWFEEIKPEQWFTKDKNFDDLIVHKFMGLYDKASEGELKSWRKSAKGALAEIIVLDQFPRNMFRDAPKSFATDRMALEAAEEAISSGLDEELNGFHLAFLYMPFMHSESKEDHERAVTLFGKPGLEMQYGFELKHKVIIDRFGRYPHRNKILGRESTPEEIEFLKEEDSSF
uniref:DUF924 domain-containing protein n=1 Tax=Corethron hystrix TaxID=216773 RepID=A0A7S1BC67_9STRA|mmetsp:Transcript_21514/g.48877  ORF Transcript_21514/g.48877 Transcript_21514/m.48877 type:complete len:264 (+) Transcript_21514:129-920(+)